MYGKEDKLEVIGYTDSDFAGCIDDRKSTNGYIFFLAGGAISWKSAKQTEISTSTMQVEYIGCYEATKQAVWLRSFIGNIVIVDSISRPLKIFCDNKAAVFFSKNNKRTSASRIMDVKYLVVRDRVKNEEIIIEHIDSQSMIADPLTKALPVGVFKDHVTRMGLVESFDQWE